MQNKAILCVDDEAVVRDIIVSTMERAGYEIYCTGDLEDAYESFCEMKPFLLIMDLILENKDMNGVVLGDRMRTYYPNTTFCAVTGYLQNFDFGRLRQVFDEILLKPVSQKVLWNVAQDAFERSIRWDSYLR
jgi:CheY-like chemotaxis protein